MQKKITYRIGDVSKIYSGGDRPEIYSDIQNSEYPIPIYSNGLDNEGLYGYTNKSQIEGDCITVAARGVNIGTVFYRPTPFLPIVRLLSVIPDRTLVNAKYLYYYFQIDTIIGTGSAQPQLTIPFFKKKKILIHEDISYQQKIASILSAYDNLIQNYKKQIEALQTAASELYKEWFVRFRFPGYKNSRFENGIPKGWKVEKVKNCVNRLPFGQTYKKDELEPEGNIIVIDQSEDEYLGYHNNEPSHKASAENPIALFGDHSCKYKLMIKDFSLGENIIPYTSKGVDLYYLYYSVYKIVQTEEYKRHWNLFVNKKVLIPNNELQKSFRQKVIPIFKQIEILNKQITNLTQQRDLLLPRLMSGKLEVK
ncbi:MAG: restriction endonuclease subunit S [Treponema sp.]|nr:restriction endonuclease subunit S [Treponema sp.]